VGFFYARDQETRPPLNLNPDSFRMTRRQVENSPLRPT
jgi:hypothetical protein